MINALTPELVTVGDDEDLEAATRRLEREQHTTHKVMPARRVAPTSLDPSYGRVKGAKHQYKFFFQDISQTGRKSDKKKCLGVLDHDGVFRPPTEEELYYRRWQPARQKKRREEEVLQDKLDEPIVSPAVAYQSKGEEGTTPSEQELYWCRFPHRCPERFRTKLQKKRMRERREETVTRHKAREEGLRMQN